MSRLTMAHPLGLAVALMASIAGCYASHGREPPPVPTRDAAVPAVDAPLEPDVACLDCSCCSCGRPSTGALCPLIGLEECCAPSPEEDDASISSATLADDCRTGGGEGDCDVEGCWCVQTGVQLALRSAGPLGGLEPVTITTVRLLRDGAVVADLSPHTFLVWDAGAAAYVPWDGTIAGGQELSVRVETSAPDWVALGGGDAWRTYGVAFGVEVTVIFRGTTHVLFLEPVLRQSEIDT